jgi:hypothetical protein
LHARYPTPARVTGTQVDDGSAQRSRVASLTVIFSTVVTLPANPAQAFRLARTGPGTPAGEVTLAVDLTGSTATQTVARLTFSGALTESGSLTDGNGDGRSGGDYTLALYRLYGDATGDRRVDNADFFQFRTRFGTSL